MYLFPLILSLFVALTSCIMVPTQLRQFWCSPFVDKQDFNKYLASKEKLMSFTRAYETDKVFYIEFKMPSIFSLTLFKAIKLLLKTDSHTLIIYYGSADKLQRAFQMYKNLKKTPQIWSHFLLAQGPLGRAVDSREVEIVRDLNFTNNRILAVGWTLPDDCKEYQEMKYTKSHIKSMSRNLGSDRRKRHIVIVFDALLLSHTPEVVGWLPENMKKLTVLIKLAYYNKEQFVNVSNLRNFIKTTKMFPFFFDLPQHLRRALIEEEGKFTTVVDDFEDVNDGSEWRIGSFRVLVGAFGLASLLGRGIWGFWGRF